MKTASVYISFDREVSRTTARTLAEDLLALDRSVWLPDEDSHAAGSWSFEAQQAIEKCDLVLALIEPQTKTTPLATAEHLFAMRYGIPLIPVMLGADSVLPTHLNHLKPDSTFSPGQPERMRRERLSLLLKKPNNSSLPERWYETPCHAPAPDEGYVTPSVELTRLRIFTLADQARWHKGLAVVTGEPGCGKTLLVQALAQDEIIQSAFPDGIFWLNYGPLQSDLSEGCSRIIQEMGVPAPSPHDLPRRALQQLRTQLASRAALLIVDDVFEISHALPFQLEEGQSRVLVITSQPHVALALKAPEFAMGHLPPDQSLAILQQHSEQPEDTLKPLASTLGYNPLALRLTGVFLAQGAAANKWSRKWRLTAKQLYGHEARTTREILRTCIHLMLRAIPEPFVNMIRALRSLAPNVLITEQMLSRIWADLGSAEQQAELLNELLQLSLLTQEGNPRRFRIQRLHQLIEENPNREEDQEALLDKYYPESLNWADVKDDGYIHRALAYHLMHADREEELIDLLQEPAWLHARLASTSIASLLEDYSFVSEGRTLRALQESLRLAAPILVKDPDQLSSQLTARLDRIDSIDVDQVRHKLAELPRKAPQWLHPHRTPLRRPEGILRRILTSHLDAARAVVAHPDGSHCISASDDGSVACWEVATGLVAYSHYGNGEPITCLDVSEAAGSFIAGTESGQVLVFALADGALINTIDAHDGVIETIALSPDGTKVLSAGDDQRVMLWKLENAEVIHAWDEREAWALAFSRNGTHALIAGADPQIIECDLETGEVIHTLMGHEDSIWALALTPDGRNVISASEDQTLIVWSLENGSAQRVLRGHQGGVRAVAVSPDGEFVASAAEDHSLMIWRLSTGNLERSLSNNEDWIWDLVMLGDASQLITATDEGSLKVWETEVATSKGDAGKHVQTIRALHVTRDDAHLISGSDDRSVRIWHLESGTNVAAFNGHQDWVWDVALTSDGRYAASASFDHTIRVWDLVRHQLIHELVGHSDWVWRSAFSPDGAFLVSASEDQSLIVWDIETGEKKHTLTGHEAGVSTIAILGESNSIISGSADHTLKVWNLRSGELIETLTGHEDAIKCLCVSPMNRCIISGSEDRTIRTWDSNDWTPIEVLSGHKQGVRHLVTLPFGMYVVSAGEDQRICVWDVQENKLKRTLHGHQGEIRSIALMEDERFAVSAGDDHALFFWNLETGNKLASHYSDAPFTSCTVARDGQTIVAGDAQGGLHIMKLANTHSMMQGV